MKLTLCQINVRSILRLFRCKYNDIEHASFYNPPFSPTNLALGAPQHLNIKIHLQSTLIRARVLALPSGGVDTDALRTQPSHPHSLLLLLALIPAQWTQETRGQWQVVWPGTQVLQVLDSHNGFHAGP